MVALWIVTTFILVERYQHCGGTRCFHLHGRNE